MGRKVPEVVWGWAHLCVLTTANIGCVTGRASSVLEHVCSSELPLMSPQGQVHTAHGAPASPLPAPWSPRFQAPAMPPAVLTKTCTPGLQAGAPAARCPWNALPLLRGPAQPFRYPRHRSPPEIRGFCGGLSPLKSAPRSSVSSDLRRGRRHLDRKVPGPHKAMTTPLPCSGVILLVHPS